MEDLLVHAPEQGHFLFAYRILTSWILVVIMNHKDFHRRFRY
jgi:hypothetical protein